MQSTGQTSTHEASLTPMHGSAITYVMASNSGLRGFSFGGGEDTPTDRLA
jgi:hypothetical protein